MARSYMQAEAQALARKAEIQTLNKAVWRRNDKIARLRRENESLRAALATAQEVITTWAAKGFLPPLVLEGQPRVVPTPAPEPVVMPPSVKALSGPLRLTEADRAVPAWERELVA